MIVTPNLNAQQLFFAQFAAIVLAGLQALNRRFDRLYASYLKRLFDLAVSVTVLVMAAPTIFVVAMMVRLKLGSPVLFTQQRPGLHGDPFFVFKFRTMTDERDADGKLLPDEVRLTAFGKFLRKWSLDELPQLLNVVKGDISLVGPRPLLMHYLDRYSAEQARRHEVHPGVTGLAQVNGRNAISWEEKFAYDTHYVDNVSFWLDFKILLLTAKKLVKPQDISQAGHATMSEFMGTQTVEAAVVTDTDATVEAPSIREQVIAILSKDETVPAIPAIRVQSKAETQASKSVDEARVIKVVQLAG